MPNFGAVQQFNKIPVLGLVPEKNASAPAAPVSGQLWADTSVTPAKLRWYDGTQWVAADASVIAPGAITDTHIAAGAAIALSKLAVNPLARANHTGTQLAATISDFNTAVRLNRLDQLTVPQSNVDFGAQRITGVSDPILGTDAATKAYADNARAGFAGVKTPVRVVATANVDLASLPVTIDGVTMAAGDRFLATAQSTGTQNGIQTYSTAGGAATRPTDADQLGEILDGTLVAVAEGTLAGYQFIQTGTPAGTFAAWAQAWTVFTTGGQTYTAGTGLTLTGTQFALTTPVPISLGGTGATTVAAARTALGAPGTYAATLPALTAGVAVTVTHNLGTKDVHVTTRTTADDRRLDLDWTSPTTTTVTVQADLAFAAGAVRVVVSG